MRNSHHHNNINNNNNNSINNFTNNQNNNTVINNRRNKSMSKSTDDMREGQRDINLDSNTLKRMLKPMMSNESPATSPEMTRRRWAQSVRMIEYKTFSLSNKKIFLAGMGPQITIIVTISLIMLINIENIKSITETWWVMWREHLEVIINK